MKVDNKSFVVISFSVVFGISQMLSLSSCTKEESFATERFHTESIDEDNNFSLSVVLDMPVKGNSKLVNNITEWVNERICYSSDQILKNGQDITDYYINHLLDDFKGESEDMYDIVFIQDSLYVKYETEKYITYGHDHSDYLGGAHGFDSYICSSFRKSDGHQLGWEIFNKDANLKKLIKKGLKEYFEVDNDNELMEQLQLEDPNATINTLPLPKTEPWLTDEGIVFHYESYEIACYAAGTPEFVISKEKAENYLTPEALELFK